MILWAVLDITSPRGKAMAGQRSFALIMAAMFTQILYGAFLAGLHGGLIFNTFPTMNGAWMAPEVNGEIFTNIASIQFIHRWLAVALLISMGAWQWRYGRQLRAAWVVMALLIGQCMLGVATLLHMVPLPLAIAHQLTALALFLACIITYHALKQGSSAMRPLTKLQPIGV